MALKKAFEPLDKTIHDIKAFHCDKPVMDEFLRRYAAKNAKLGLSKTWVLSESEASGKLAVAAYFTLAVQSVSPDDLHASNLPRYPDPVTLIARLAVDSTYQGKGLGSKTLLSALAQAVKIYHNGLPTYAVVLDVLDDEAMRFYEKFEFFKQLGAYTDKLYVPMAVLQQIFEPDARGTGLKSQTE